jgi:hypothetical protein
MGDQIIRGKCQNLSGTDGAAHAHIASRREKMSSVKKLSRSSADWNWPIGMILQIKSDDGPFPDHAPISAERDLIGKPASTFPDHAPISAEHDLIGKPASTFPDHALEPAIRR